MGKKEEKVKRKMHTEMYTAEYLFAHTHLHEYAYFTRFRYRSYIHSSILAFCKNSERLRFHLKELNEMRYTHLQKFAAAGLSLPSNGTACGQAFVCERVRVTDADKSRT